MSKSNKQFTIDTIKGNLIKVIGFSNTEPPVANEINMGNNNNNNKVSNNDDLDKTKSKGYMSRKKSWNYHNNWSENAEIFQTRQEKGAYY